jgi:hypothetical protein
VKNAAARPGHDARETTAHCRKLAAMWSKSEGWMAPLNFRRAGDIRARFNAKQGTADERHDIRKIAI